MSDTLTAPRTDQSQDLSPTDPGDHDRFSHYVKKAAIGDALVFGTPLEALCGKKWVPSRDPSRFPVCPECKGRYDELVQLYGDK
jgi:hypothetical protein